MIDISTFIYLCGFQGLVRKGRNWNFRCPICGDSKRSKSKKRGWVLWNNKTNGWVYYCHNCFYSNSFLNYLKEYHDGIYKEYLRETLFKRENNGQSSINKLLEEQQENQKQKTYNTLKLKTIHQLEKDHPAYQYFIKRKIPKKFFKYFYYVDEFKSWVNSKIPDKFENLEYDEPRIIIPFYTIERKIFAIAGRSLKKETNLRYITIKFSDHKKVFGLERVKFDKEIFVFEGQFDSIFMPNSIAMGGADLDIEYLSELAPKENYVFVFDLENRNPEICKKIENVINAGFKICLLPKKYKKYGKDINEMIINSLSTKRIYTVIQNNIFIGTKAKIKFNIWKNVKLK